MKDVKIYTKTGDAGTTSLWSGKRVSKNHARLHAYGTIDELNSQLGLLVCDLESTSLSSSAKIINQIQNTLFLLGSYISCDEQKWLDKLPALQQEWIDKMESQIDQMTDEMPPLSSFILPNGHRSACLAHIARCVCRRAEREFIACKEDVFENVYIETYLNRLSDYLFTFARWINYKHKIMDIPWEK